MDEEYCSFDVDYDSVTGSITAKGYLGKNLNRERWIRRLVTLIGAEIVNSIPIEDREEFYNWLCNSIEATLETKLGEIN